MTEWFRQHKPDWVYNSLPYCYIFAGIGTMVLIANLTAVFAGSMLILAGVNVYMMRRQARKPIKDVATKFVEQIREEENDQGLMHISLTRANESGHPVIDAQHRDLCATANAPLDAVMSGRPSAEIQPILTDLEKDLEVHFKTEEAVLAKIDPLHAAKHKQLHDDMLKKALHIIEHCRQGKMDVREIINFVAYEFVEHISKEDKQFFAKIRKGIA
jgi:hemerythrin-like metal-binding protein